MGFFANRKGKKPGFPKIIPINIKNEELAFPDHLQQLIKNPEQGSGFFKISVILIKRLIIKVNFGHVIKMIL